MLGFVLTVLFAHNLLIGVSKTDIDDTKKMFKRVFKFAFC